MENSILDSVKKSFQKISETPQDTNTDDPWKRLVTVDNTDEVPEDPITTITCDFKGLKIVFREPKEYAYKLATILESSRVKEELGEQLIGYREEKKGFFNKKQATWILTNYRVIYLSSEIGELVQIPLKYVDITVTNAHSISTRNGAIAGGAAPGFIYAGMGFTQGQSTSQRIGDLNFIFNGQILIVMQDVPDPNGLKQLLYQIKKQIHNVGGVYE